MSELHHLLTFPQRPITKDYYETQLKHYLKSGIPATYTLEQIAEYEREEKLKLEQQENETNEKKESTTNDQENDTSDDDEDETISNTTPLHTLARSLPLDLTKDEENIVLELINILFEFGAGWNFIDFENKSIGDLLLEKNPNIESNILYNRIIEAGVSAELLLRALTSSMLGEEENKVPIIPESHDDATAANQNTYLNTKLEYTDDSLITENNKDGVMMDWETDIMKLAAKNLSSINEEETNVLNIGFGMGIIDTFIQSYNPKHHYICEAHPDVLAYMKKNGWYEKPNVTILEGRWQDTLPTLFELDEPVFFDGIYYDTFSEHYTDMLDLYDTIVGLLKPEGIFSFFNGLGADRRICYDVYKKIVEIDVSQYGLECTYTTIDVSQDKHRWDDVRRSYFDCPVYYHPEIRFK